MKAMLLAVSLVITAISPPASGQTSFVTYHLSNGSSLELPRSWTATTNFNQDLNEIGQSAYDVVQDKMAMESNGNIKIPNANIKTELFATKRMASAVASVFVSFIELSSSTKDTQLQLSQMNDENKLIMTNTIKTSLVKGKIAPPNITVTMERRGKLYVFMSKFLNARNKLDKETIVQIPLDSRILQLQFRSQSKDGEMWDAVFDKIILSVKTKK